jgi:hypothetical protein
MPFGDVGHDDSKLRPLTNPAEPVGRPFDARERGDGARPRERGAGGAGLVGHDDDQNVPRGPLGAFALPADCRSEDRFVQDEYPVGRFGLEQHQRVLWARVTAFGSSRTT